MILLRLLLRLSAGLASRVRNRWYRALGVRIDGYAWLRRISVPRQWSDIHLHAGVSLDDGVTLLASGPPRAGKLTIGSGTYVNRHTMFDAHDRIEVGARCLIGPFCYITDSDHVVGPDGSVTRGGMRSRAVVLEDEVWLGAGVTVLKGVRIGRGAVVGAGAVVTADVPVGATVAGVPARVLRRG